MADLSSALGNQLRTIHAVKSGALAMFDPMLADVAAERDDRATSPEIVELLGRMHGAFSKHRQETAEHARRLANRIDELGGHPATTRVRALSMGASGWVRLSRIGGQNHGANARNAFVFEHLEIASLRLLEQMGERSEDEATGDLARSCLADDEEMAATIGRNWTNVLTLSLA